MKKLSLTISAILLLAFNASSALAADFWVTGKITRIFSSTSEHFGGCMIKMDVEINPTDGTVEPTPACIGNWVGFGCEDATISKDVSSRNYATALLASSLGKNVSILVDNSKMFASPTRSPLSFCMATRIDII